MTIGREMSPENYSNDILFSTMTMTYLPITSLLAVSIGPIILRGRFEVNLGFGFDFVFVSNKVAVLGVQRIKDTHRTPPEKKKLNSYSKRKNDGRYNFFSIEYVCGLYQTRSIFSPLIRKYDV